ncbi:molecular chaperone GrpE [Desulfuromusa kysingii]|uniref:Protein GrpE n=1 Tax=Desulfuromusa kysingii TaxID=37625 RepID=A0A1H4E000_9BACT|nr:nucleotide exchange factor GrpE [Desulfuromusa kysingii]SEA78089.1 molecular chaperone GrpE [Desulfuromusa kysingii]
MTKQNEEKEPETELETAENQEPEVVEEDDEKERLQDELTKALSEAKVHQEQYLRTLAEMENLRKRTQRDKEDLAKFANENILREILPVIDNLERAVEHAEQAESNDGLFEGVQMTLSQFSQLLTKFGVKPVDAMGQPFDPAYHQAMGQMESEEHPVNTVVQQMQKGYELNNRLLRPAFVMLAKAPEQKQTEADDSAEEQ